MYVFTFSLRNGERIVVDELLIVAVADKGMKR